MRRAPTTEIASLCLAALMAASCSCSRNAPVRLDLDFPAGRSLCYSLRVVIEGTAALADSSRPFASTAEGTFCAGQAPSSAQRVSVSFSGVRINSSLLEPPEAADLERRLSAAPMQLVWRDGMLLPADSASVPDLRLGDWSLYRVLSRTLPSLPGRPVAVGEQWEGQRWLPLHGAFGDGMGHLYQVFRLDSLTAGRSLAHVSWTFSYRVEVMRSQGSGPSSAVPRGGSGEGWAVLDLGRKVLTQARIQFHVPANQADSAGVRWIEQVDVRMAQ